VKLSKRVLTGALAIPLIAALAGALVFQVNLRHAGADATFETLANLKTIDEDWLPIDDQGEQASNQDNGGRPSFGNVFVNDPCLDPAASLTPPANRQRTVQSETSIGVLRAGGSQFMVAGYNQSAGFYDNTRGLSGYAYSVDGGAHWVDGGGLPPLRPTHAGIGDRTVDHYAGDPVIAVDQRSGTFYYSSIYLDLAGHQTMAVNRGHFAAVPPVASESNSNTRCQANPALQGVPDTSNLPAKRIVWEPPVVAVTQFAPHDALDKEWLFVSQKTGELYLTYTRFAGTGATPLELVRSMDGGHTWTAPSVIVPNQIDTFNQATQPIVTPDGRVIVSWIARTFSAGPNGPGTGPEASNHVEVALSNDDGATFGSPIVGATTNPQGEPPGYNRGRRSILNAPFITFGGAGDDSTTEQDTSGAIYLTFFSGNTSLVNPDGSIYTGPLARSGNILLSRSTNGGQTWSAPVKVNDDAGVTSHVFPSVQATQGGKVFVSWLDRRNDATNELTNEWADVSLDGGQTFGVDQLESSVATNWRVRADARPNFGDYNSSVLLNPDTYALIWADGRFPPPGGSAATPDVIFTVAQGLNPEG
jgi:hypothetical protein